MGLFKGKCKSKKAGKKFLKLLSGKGKGTFFGKEVLRKCAKSKVGNKGRKRINNVN
jgi:hypothetical protein